MLTITDRIRRRAAGGAVAALLILGVSAFSPRAAAQAPAGPTDALTLVRQALAALEVTPPAVSVATGKVIKALFSADTYGVDMPRVREAAQALGVEDTTAAAAYLMEALRPAQLGPARIDMALVTPVRVRFTATPAAYALLAVAALLVAAGTRIARG